MKKTAPHTSSAARRKVEFTANQLPEQYAQRVHADWIELNKAPGLPRGFTEGIPASGRKLRRMLKALGFNAHEASMLARAMEGKA